MTQEVNRSSLYNGARLLARRWNGRDEARMFQHLGLHLVFALLRKLFPLPEDYAESGPSLLELKPTFGKWYTYSIVAFFACLPLATIAWWWLLNEIFEWNARRFEPAVLHFYASGIPLCVPALFWAMVSCKSIVDFVCRRQFGDQFPLFVRYSNLTSNINSQRLERWVMGPVAVCLCLATLTLLNWHVVIRDDRIDFQTWLGFSNTSQTYDRVVDIRTAPQQRAPNGAAVHRREYEIEFADGTRWSTTFVDTYTAKFATAKYISERSGKPIREVAILE